MEKFNLKKYLPVLEWLPNYSRRFLFADLTAGLTLVAITVPMALAYAQMAGLPPVAGFFAAPAALLGYALFSSSRQVVVAPTSAMAVMSAAIVSLLAIGGSEEFITLTAALAVITGALFLIFGFARMGFISNFMSKPVVIGFIFGLTLFVVIRQVPKLFGIEGIDGNFFQMAFYTVGNLHNTHGWTILIGATSLILLFALERFAPRAPAALITVVYGILLVSFLNLYYQGVYIIGDIPSALPKLSVPNIGFDNILALLPGAFGLVFVGFAETFGVGRTFASKHNYEIDANQELIALGVSNLGSGFSQGFAVDASMAQSATNDRAGAKTEMSAIIAAGLVLVTAFALTPLFHNLPEATLAAIVIHAVWRMMRVKELKRIYHIRRLEFFLASVALMGVLAFNLLIGLIVAIVASLLAITFQASRPYLALLGKVPGQNVYRDIKRHPENQVVSGIIIIRLDAPLFFANADRIHDEIRHLVQTSKTPVKAILLNLESTNELDVSSIDMLSELKTQMETLGIDLLLAHVHGSVRDILRRSGLAEKIGEESIYHTINQAVYAFQKRHPFD